MYDDIEIIIPASEWREGEQDQQHIFINGTLGWCGYLQQEDDYNIIFINLAYLWNGIPENDIIGKHKRFIQQLCATFIHEFLHIIDENLTDEQIEYAISETY